MSAAFQHQTRWTILPQSSNEETTLMRACNLPRLVARVLVSRGKSDPYDVQTYLSADIERDWEDPYCIPGMHAATQRIRAALKAHERIAVFGDFDVDGITSTCLLTQALTALGATVTPFIPNRTHEGYGLSVAALTRLLNETPAQLIITVDNGISAASEVEWLRSRGVDVVVTDHHEPDNLVPAIDEVCNPKLDVTCPSYDLAGVGVALKLVCALGAACGTPSLWKDYLEFAALGTLADMMELTCENRAIVTAGLERLHYTRTPGLLALARVSGIDIHSVTSEELPFSLIPRLNAAGRMDSTMLAYHVLCADRLSDAFSLASQLEAVNTLRKEKEAEVTKQALEQAERMYKNERVLVVAGADWAEGVKGIVAARLQRRYHVPCIVCSIQDGVAKGSGRTAGSIDLFAAVQSCSDVLERFGGHQGAVGITCAADALDTFRARLQAYMNALPAEQFDDTDEISAVVSLSEITVQSLDSLEIMQPFGKGNERPLFAARGVIMKNKAKVGSQGNHLRFVAVQGNTRLDAILFRAAHIDELMANTKPVDIVFSASNETWQGRIKPKLIVQDIVQQLPDGSVHRYEAHPLLEHMDAHMLSSVRSLCAGDCDSCAYGSLMPDLMAQPAAYNASMSADAAASVASAAASTAAACPAEASDVHHNGRLCAASSLLSLPSTSAHTTPVSQLSDSDIARSIRSELARMSRANVSQFVLNQLIGTHTLHPVQKRAIDLLAHNTSCMCVMATGRGKSLIFQVHALICALCAHTMSIFVYPLRALANDQYYHLSDVCDHFGVRVRMLCGATLPDERARIMDEMVNGNVDIVMTTPEYLAIHTADFAHRVGFVVFDEAHHIAAAKAGARTAYLDMPSVLEQFNNPTCIALSATMNDADAQEVCQVLSIDTEHVLVDSHVRTNLDVVDMHNSRHRRAQLTSLVSHGEKMVVYVNSRACAQELVVMLRHKLPEYAPRIAFYHAGLTRLARQRVERAFRSDDVYCIVATSAFGEGVNIPDIRSVVLYHLPFSFTDLNQMSGRAGRDGKPATIYTLYTQADAHSNSFILSTTTPSRSEVAVVYQALSSMCQRSDRTFPHACSVGDASWHITLQISDILADIRAHVSVGALSVSCIEQCLAILRDVGIISYEQTWSARAVHHSAQGEPEVELEPELGAEVEPNGEPEPESEPADAPVQLDHADEVESAASRSQAERDNVYYRISMVKNPNRVMLEKSLRYVEGIRMWDAFEHFSSWAQTATCAQLLDRIQKPIVPHCGEHINERDS